MSAPLPAGRAAIRVLAPHTAERIAAGEVVERPASVVKELLENALDAGARAIRMEVRGGGLRLIRMVDDGCGIPADEIPLAFQRHATSKIQRVEDLDQLATLGFRGEALPSIAAVADVTMLTAADQDGLGTEAVVQRGAVASLTPRPRSRGTTVAVRYLFQTVPARLKFVASARHEVAAIGALVRRYALAYPDVRLTLTVEGRPSFEAAGVGLAAALVAVHGAAVAEALQPLPPLEVAGARLHGYLGARHVTRPHRGGITLVVNGRWVEARELLTALESAYRPLLPRGRHPIALLYCDLPASAVDVNVHPAKTEIKLERGRELAEGLGAWVRTALGRTAAHLPADVDLGWRLPLAAADAPRETATTAWPYAAATGDWSTGARVAEHGDTLEEGTASGRASAGNLPPLRLIGQVQDTLLLCEGPAGLYLVDQHRAHERILYERLRARHQPPPEAPVEPLVLELRPAQAARLAVRLPQLAALGFVCEWFGGRSFLVRATPALGAAGGLAGATAALGLALDDVLGEAAADDGDWQDRLLISTACHSALRRGQILARETQDVLLAALDATAAPAVCPHGSPLILHLSEPFLARQFRWR